MLGAKQVGEDIGSHALLSCLRNCRRGWAYLTGALWLLGGDLSGDRLLGTVKVGCEGEQLLDRELLGLCLIGLLDAALEDLVLLNFLVEHDCDLIDLKLRRG